MSIDDLDKKGWFQTRISNSVNFFDKLLEYASELGSPVKGRKSLDIIQKLVPISSCKAHPYSLSSKYATGAFPLHIDTVIPPKSNRSFK